MVAEKNSLFARGPSWRRFIAGLIACVTMTVPSPGARLNAQIAVNDFSDDDFVADDDDVKEDAGIEQLAVRVGRLNAAIADRLVNDRVFGFTGVAADAPARHRVQLVLEQKLEVVDA